MAKVKFVIEAEIDERVLQDMDSSSNDYVPLTIEEYVEGIKTRFVDGRYEIRNKVEEYYNINEGDAQCLKNFTLVDMKLEEGTPGWSVDTRKIVYEFNQIVYKYRNDGKEFSEAWDMALNEIIDKYGEDSEAVKEIAYKIGK